MSYFLASDHEPITLRAVVESIESSYLKYADYNLSGLVEFAIAIVLYLMGMYFFGQSFVSAVKYLRDDSIALRANVKQLASTIDIKDERKIKKVGKSIWYILGIIYYLLRMLFNVLLFAILLGISCAMVWYAGKYFVQLFQ